MLAVALHSTAARGCGCRGFTGWSGTMVSRYERKWIWSIETPGAVEGAVDRRHGFGFGDGRYRHRVGGIPHRGGQDNHLPRTTECFDPARPGSERSADGLGQSAGPERSAAAAGDL